MEQDEEMEHIVWDTDSESESELESENNSGDEMVDLVFYTLECGCVVEQEDIEEYIQWASGLFELECGCVVRTHSGQKLHDLHWNGDGAMMKKQDCGCRVRSNNPIRLHWSPKHWGPKVQKWIHETSGLDYCEDVSDLVKDYAPVSKKRKTMSNSAKKAQAQREKTKYLESVWQVLRYFSIQQEKLVAEMKNIEYRIDKSKLQQKSKPQECETQLLEILKYISVESVGKRCLYREVDGWI
ncbi:MAG: hypothetical protein ACTSUE_23715 [Promethearchaeota archaeon]